MTCSLMPPLAVAGESNRGCVRSHNEDNFCYVSLHHNYLMAAVADGVGGYSGGEVASYLCCHRLMLEWKKLFKSGHDPANSEIAGFLQHALTRANQDIYTANHEQKRSIPMCTTVAAAVFTPDMIITAHAGDSRIYCLRNGKCILLTVDHTVQNELLEQGKNNPDNIPGAHVISRALGAHSKLKLEMHSFFRNADDRFLLCSDGLTTYWSNQEIANVFAESSTPHECNDRLLRGTLCRGAADNVTVISILPGSPV